MKTIYKYKVPIEDEFNIRMPYGSVILCVQCQDGLSFIWVYVDTDKSMIDRSFILRGTGHVINHYTVYIGTFQMMEGNLVYHLFEH